MGQLKNESQKADNVKEVAVPETNISERGEGFWRRRPSVDLRVTYPDVKMQGIVKNTVIKLKGVAHKNCSKFERRTCANPKRII
jgi:hypothetical protein